MSSSKAEHIRIKIEGEMTISRVAELKEQIMPTLLQAGEVEIDLSGVTEIDAAGMQLMLAAKLESIVRDVKLAFIGHSQVVQDVLDLCDLGSFFGDPMVISSKSS